MDSFTRAQTVYLPRKWVLQHTLAWLDQNRRMSLGTTKGCAPTGEAFIYATMTRLMVRGLVCA
jgi:hypothetical protein